MVAVAFQLTQFWMLFPKIEPTSNSNEGGSEVLVPEAVSLNGAARISELDFHAMELRDYSFEFGLERFGRRRDGDEGFRLEKIRHSNSLPEKRNITNGQINYF
jgi:hypothetical protein